jgi:hypothetical protein
MVMSKLEFKFYFHFLVSDLLFESWFVFSYFLIYRDLWSEVLLEGFRRISDLVQLVKEYSHEPYADHPPQIQLMQRSRSISLCHGVSEVDYARRQPNATGCVLLTL